ncbi:MAG: site-specific integrase [Selenomonas sp.]|nr:site-specific integrase [Selenomonas sp.]
MTDTLSTKALSYMSKAKAENTLRAYTADWADFEAYCQRSGLDCLPAAPATVANYLADRAEDLKTATLTRRLTAINTVHEEAGFQSPVTASIVRLTLAGIKREKVTRQTAKAPIRVEDLRRLMAMNVFHGLTGLRDRALLLLGFAAALRRSELANVRAEDLTFTGAGAVLLLPRSKGDQQGKGAEIALPSAEDQALSHALMAWLSAAHIQRGPIFQSIDLRAHLSGKAITPRTVAEIVKRYAARLGYDERQFSGHSLRRGFATEASASGASLPAIMHHTRHKSEKQALKYVEAGRNFIDSPLKRII